MQFYIHVMDCNLGVLLQLKQVCNEIMILTYCLCWCFESETWDLNFNTHNLRTKNSFYMCPGVQKFHSIELINSYVQVVWNKFSANKDTKQVNTTSMQVTLTNLAGTRVLELFLGDQIRRRIYPHDPSGYQTFLQNP